MASAADPSAPQFVLKLSEGQGLLGLKQPLSLPLGTVEQLDLEVPNLRFPLDGSGDSTRFRTRRCKLREARLRLDEEQVADWLARRPLARYGIEEVGVRLAGAHFQLSGAIAIGDRRSTFTCA